MLTAHGFDCLAAGGGEGEDLHAVVEAEAGVHRMLVGDVFARYSLTLPPGNGHSSWSHRVAPCTSSRGRAVPLWA
jgi:hypothetical protein